jgi:hypothetical protein
VANKNTRRKEKKKPKRGTDKITASPVVITPPVKVIAKGKAAKEPKE